MERYYEHEHDGAERLKEVDEARFGEIKHSGRGLVTVGAGPDTHHIAGSRMLSKSIGGSLGPNGLVIYGARGEELRTYSAPTWFEGDAYSFEVQIF